MKSNKPNSQPLRQDWAYFRRGAPQYCVWISIGFVAIYFAWYFLQPEGEFRRLDRLSLLLLPAELLGSTVGHGQSHLVVGVLDRVLPLSLTAIWLVLAWWIGRPAVQIIAKRLSWIELHGLSCLVGLSLLSTLTLLIGLAGWLNRPMLAAGVIVLCAISFAIQWMHKTTSAEATVIVPSELLVQGQVGRWVWRLVPVCVCVFAAMYVANAWMPPIEFDVVEYHAQAPREFFEKGKIEFSPHNVYINMPLGLEMHTLAGMVLVGGNDGWWLGSIVGSSVFNAIFLIAVGIASGYSARYHGRWTGWATAAALLSAPGNVYVSGLGLIDAALGAYLLAGVVCLQVWREVIASSASSGTSDSSQSSIANFAAPMLACFFAGSAATAKYTGFVFGCIPVVLFIAVYAYRKLAAGHSVKLAVAGSLICLTTSGLWLVKNTLATGNPVYPLASKLFGSGNLTDAQIDRWQKAHEVPLSAAGSAFDWASMSGSLTSLAGKSHFVPAILFPMLCIGLYVCGFDLWRHPAGPPLMFGVWVLLVWWFATHRIERFWFPSLPLFTIVAAVGMRWLITRALSAAVGLCLLITLVYAMVVSILGNYSDSRWFVSYESLRKDSGTEEAPGRIPKTIGWINSNLAVGGKILAIGEARAFLFEQKILYATCFNTPIGESELQSSDLGQRSAWLAENGITHLLIQWNEIERYRSPGNYGFSTWPQQSDIQELINSGAFSPVAEWPFPDNQAQLLKFNER
jgi:hypothetical protein